MHWREQVHRNLRETRSLISASREIGKAIGLGLLILGTGTTVAVFVPNLVNSQWWPIAAFVVVFVTLLFELIPYTMVVEQFPKFTPIEPDEKLGDARWATDEEIHKLCKNSEGVLVGFHNGRPVRVNSDGHILLFGGTGQGKGSCFVMRWLYELQGSAIIFDPKGELAAMFYKYLSKKGQVIVINPFQVLASEHRPYMRSRGFNPFGTLPRGRFKAVVEEVMMTVAQAMIRETHGDKAFFPKQAAQIFAACGIYLHVRMTAPEFGSPNEPVWCTPTHIRTLVGKPLGRQADGKAIGLTAALESICSSGINAAANKAGQYLTTSEGSSGAIMTALSDTGCLDREEIAHDGCGPGIEWNKTLKNGDRPAFVFVVLPFAELDERKCSPWARMVFGSAIGELISTGKGRWPVDIVIDEAAQLGLLPILAHGHSTGRFAGLKFRTVWQYKRQLQKYGDDEDAFFGNSDAVVSFKPRDEETARWLSEGAGQRAIKVRSRSNNMTIDNRQLESFTDTDQAHALVQPAQLRRMDRGKVFVMAEGVKFPMELDAIDYRQKPAIAKKLDPHPYHEGRMDADEEEFEEVEA